MTEAKWKECPKECLDCGHELEVLSEDPRPAWVYDGDPVRCPDCGAKGMISCSAEDDPYVIMCDK